MERPFESLDRQVFMILPLRVMKRVGALGFLQFFSPHSGISLITIAPAFLLYH